jgi:hypothetical protein
VGLWVIRSEFRNRDCQSRRSDCEIKLCSSLIINKGRGGGRNTMLLRRRLLLPGIRRVARTFPTYGERCAPACRFGAGGGVGGDDGGTLMVSPSAASGMLASLFVTS